MKQKPEKPDESLEDLLSQTGADPSQIPEIAEDIRQGLELLLRHDRVEIPSDLLGRIEGRIRQELKMPTGRYVRPRFVWYHQVRRAAALAAVLLLAFLGMSIWTEHFRPTGRNGGTMTSDEGPSSAEIAAAETQLWRLNLVQMDEPAVDMDDLLISEVVQLWSDSDWEVDKVFEEKEPSHEKPMGNGNSPDGAVVRLT
ncbi:MAG: hypothetical protein JW810_11420 [Sedimentisphaerales bacterium]|nr:hypothetical protein [Sedimentisphaerales bacterium]